MAPGRGLLAEAEDGPQPGGVFRTRGVFMGSSWSVWPLRVGTIATHGWDPWLAREQGEPIPEMSDRRRYRLGDERSAEVAALLDGASWDHWDPDDREEAGGFPYDKLEALLVTHVLRSPPPPVVERNDGYLMAEFSCPACGWWGRGAELIESDRDGTRLLAYPNCDAALSTPDDSDLAPSTDARSAIFHEWQTHADDR